MTGYEMYLDVKKFMDFGPPGVEVHCLHGGTIPTVEKYLHSATRHKIVLLLINIYLLLLYF